jgi:Domain of unknown function (DUF2357)/PD-(D/E)XK nuclease superfamily
MSELRAVLRGDGDRPVGSLTVARLPGRSDLLDVDPDDDRRFVMAEGGTYRFEIDLDWRTDSVRVEPAELFSFDDERRLRGRMQPRQHVGRLRVRIEDARSGRDGWAEFDVRPTKLRYEREYRRMLEDVTDVATEALLQGFAPAALALEVDPEARPDLLYQQFALLHARLSSPELQGAIARVVHDPHVTWTKRVELQPPGRAIPGSSMLGRALSRPGPRAPTHGLLAVDSAPLAVQRERTDPSLDSVPNQFVKYALRRWRTVAQHLADNLGVIEAVSGPIRRGRDVVAQVLRQLDGYLAEPLFREVGELTMFPGSNQVLQKQHGYRQILRTFVFGELGGRLSFEWDIEDAFSASQRNVATLYEYWAFLQLAEAVGAACGESRVIEALTSTSDGLSLSFKQGQASAVRWRARAGERDLDVDLFFNRTFLVSPKHLTESSWSRAMRPDASIRVRPRSHLPELADQGDLDLWLHFDAKYRLEAAKDQFARASVDDAEAAQEAEVAERTTTTKREDLLKMHAYRDAIRRSAGAYVLYPGDDTSPPFREYAEVLPGLGAFVLRPGPDAAAEGRAELKAFLVAVLIHAAERATHHERDRYWHARVYAAPRRADGRGSRLPDLDAPPSDTLVLCGYLRSQRQEAWVRQVSLYNTRAGDRRGALGPDASELRADWLLLYREDGSRSLWSRDGSWFVQTREQLVALGYPSPGGPVYFCAPVAEHLGVPSWLDAVRIDQLPRPKGRPPRAPFAISWADLLEVEEGATG